MLIAQTSELLMQNVGNRISSATQIDLENFDVSSYNHPIEGLRLLQEVIKGNKSLDLYQCSCGKFFLFPASELSKVTNRIVDNILLCNSCAPKGTKISFQVTSTDQTDEKAVVNLLSQVFNDAKSKNLFSFCYYLWSVLPKSKNVDVMLDTVSTFQSVIGRISAEKLANEMGVKLPPALGNFHDKTETVLKLMVYCHLHETTDFLDILFVLLLIATSEYRSIIHDEQGVPAMKLPPEGLIATDVYKKLPIIIKLCKRGGYIELAKLLKKIYKSQIRNAVYHSQYEIVDNNILLRYKLDYEDTEFVEETLSLDDFTSLYKKMMILYLTLLEGLIAERDELINQGSVSEDGVTITPMVEGNGFSVRVQW